MRRDADEALFEFVAGVERMTAREASGFARVVEVLGNLADDDKFWLGLAALGARRFAEKLEACYTMPQATDSQRATWLGEANEAGALVSVLKSLEQRWNHLEASYNESAAIDGK